MAFGRISCPEEAEMCAGSDVIRVLSLTHPNPQQIIVGGIKDPNDW